jgi:hypothetical protein
MAGRECGASLVKVRACSTTARAPRTRLETAGPRQPQYRRRRRRRRRRAGPELVIDHLPGLRIRLILRGYPLSVGVARPESPGATHTLTGYPLRVWVNPSCGGRVELRGGDAATNSAVLRRVLAGEPGPVRDVVLLNAAAAIATTELSGRALAEQLAVCIDRCADAIDSGRAVATLERWTAATRRRR